MSGNILVTGGNGLIAGYLKRVGSCILTPGKDELDISDAEGLRLFFDKNDIEAVINCAGTAEQSRPEDLVNLYEINTVSAGKLSLLCKERDIPFVYISTGRVFDGLKQKPYSETDTPNPVDDYGLSKYSGERLTQSILAKKRYYIFRVSSVLGFEPQHEESRRMLNRLFTGIVKGERIMCSDNMLNSFIYAKDLAEQILYVLESGLPKGIYHMTGRGIASFSQLMNHFQKRLTNVYGIGMSSEAEIISVPQSVFDNSCRQGKNLSLCSDKLPVMCDWKTAANAFVDEYCNRDR